MSPTTPGVPANKEGRRASMVAREKIRETLVSLPFVSLPLIMWENIVGAMENVESSASHFYVMQESKKT